MFNYEDLWFEHSLFGFIGFHLDGFAWLGCVLELVNLFSNSGMYVSNKLFICIFHMNFDPRVVIQLKGFTARKIYIIKEN